MNDDNPLTVKELREHLKQFPDNMPCFYSYCSAWTPLTAGEITKAQVIEKGGFVDIVSSRRRYNDPNDPRIKDALLFPGN